MNYDPERIRPKRDWALVLAEQRRVQLDSGILLPIETGAEKVTEGCGIIIRVGPGEKGELLSLSPGQRIVYRVFLKYANPVETDEKWPDGGRKTYFLMAIDDVMGVTERGANIGVFSRPAMHSEPGEAT